MAASKQTTGRTKTTPRANPRIYVASLVDYNAGRLTGVWLEALEADQVRAGIDAMLAKTRIPGDDVAIHDFEGFGSFRVGEFDSIELVCAMGAAIVDLGEMFADFVNHIGAPQDEDDVAHLVERFQESYQGAWDSLAEWAESFLEDTGALKDVSEPLRHYIDFESWAEDAETNGDIFSVERDGKVHVFWSR